MKRLRMWVKVVLGVIVIGLLVLVFKLATDFTNNAINSCVSSGNSYEFCVRGLK